MQPARRILLTCLVLFFLSQILFLVNIQFPAGHNFDEFHYVPAAKEMLGSGVTRNWEHPPLAKKIMSFGIALWGDRPIGWRFMSAIFGSLTLVGMYLWALALFRRENLALWVAALTVFNHLLYVQARIGMLDTFLFAFLAWGLAAFTAAWDPTLKPKQARILLAATGVLLGLATASKWSGVVALGACIGLVAFIRALQFLRVRAPVRAVHGARVSARDTWYHPDLWKGLGVGTWILCLGVIPVVTYLASFIPMLDPHKSHTLFSGVSDILSMQKRMWEGQLRVVTAHPYMSEWWDWAILKRPIWYAFDRENDNAVRGVVLLGNPLIMWAGLVALLVCVWGWLRNAHRSAFLITAFYVAFYFCWLVIPRKVSFYYYYYPAGMVLSFALAYLIQRTEKDSSGKLACPSMVFLGAVTATFIYFFPILAALKIPAEAFRRWMWFPSWI